MGFLDYLPYYIPLVPWLPALQAVGLGRQNMNRKLVLATHIISVKHDPEQLAHLGLLLVHLAAGVAEVPGEAEVGDLADLVVVHQDVARGEVPVDYLEQG